MPFNPMRAAPVTREEFAEALAVIVAMTPANIERFLIDDQELRKQAERAGKPRESEEQIRDYYGVEGVHFNVA